MKKIIIFLVLIIAGTVYGQKIPIPHPAGSDTEVQYNDGGVYGADPNFTYDVNDVLNVSGNFIGPNSVAFQSYADSTTFFQILDADGGNPVFNVDSTNERVGIGTDTPNNLIQVAGLINFDNTNENTLLGTDAFANDNGQNNVGLGYQAGYNNDTTGGASYYGDQNLYIGYQAGYGATGGIKNTGFRNSFIGSNSGYSNTTGYNNFFMGYRAGYRNTTGYRNAFIGSYSGYYNTTGCQNSFISVSSGFSNTTGNNNTVIGYTSGLKTTTGDNNSFIGSCAGYSNQTGNNDTAIGYASGYNTTGSDNVFLGCNSGYRQTTNSNLLIIDNQDRGSIANEATTSLIYGTFAAAAADQTLKVNGKLESLPTYSVTVGGTNRDLYIDDTGVIGYDSSSLRYKTNIKDFNNTAFLYDLAPKIYDKDNGVKGEVGLIAEEVNNIYQKAVSFRRGENIIHTGKYFNDPNDDKYGQEITEIEYYTTDKPETVNYSKLIVPLLREVQKLNDRVTKLETNVAELEKTGVPR